MQLTCMLKRINMANFLVDIFDTNTFFKIKEEMAGFPWWLSGKSPPANAGDTGLIPGPGRSHVP